MSTRAKRQPHNFDLPIIAKAIEEYKTSCKTQKQCAAEFNIPIKVFSYYFLNGFKKHEKLAQMNGGGDAGIAKTPGAYQKKAKQRPNYCVELLPANMTNPLTGGNNVNNNHVTDDDNIPSITIAPPKKMQSPQPVIMQQRSIPNMNVNDTIRNNMKAAMTVKSNGTKRLDLEKMMLK